MDFRGRKFAIVFLLLYIQIWFLCLIQNSVWTGSGTRYMDKTYPNRHVRYFPERQWIDKDERLILVWTPMFLQWFWADTLQKTMQDCARHCVITTDRSRIQEADAVLFHMFDLWFWLGMPTYRHPSQVWVIWCAEPPTRIWKDFRGFQYTFNWTMHYRRSSTVDAPFAIAAPLSRDEEQEAEAWFARDLWGILKQKVHDVSITNSDCYDEVQRYRLIEELRQHVPVDYYGRCGNLSCPRDNEECSTKLKRYKFMIQFENSYCDDYVSEKYWNSLLSLNVPIVNWKSQQQRYPVIPHSYINIFDFPDLKSAGEYIKKVASNETLYKSYFKWRTKFKVEHTGIWVQFCHLCDALHDSTRPAQVIRDLQAWVEDDSCEKGTPWSFMERRINRHVFDLGF